jgi:ATP-dependent helicase/nuclease subunit A
MTPVDFETRQALLHDLDSSYVVEAAAGTGKTTVLVGRIVNLICTGKAQLSQVVSVTFTEKAAGELKLRLRERLEDARQATSDPVISGRLIDALKQLEIARIQTIHGLCSDLLREFPVEARVDPQFQVTSATETKAILNRVFSRQFQEVIQDPPEGIRRLLRRRPEGLNGETAREQLRRAFVAAVDKRDFSAPWRRDAFVRDEPIDRLVNGSLLRFAELKLTSAEKSAFAKAVGASAKFVEEMRHRETVSGRDYDALEAQLPRLQRSFSRFVSTKGVRAVGLKEHELNTLFDLVSSELNRFVIASEADLAACLHAELQPFVAAYELEKNRLGALDFNDLLSRTKALLQSSQSVRSQLQLRISHVFVDEFQDTDPLQTDIMLLLAARENDIVHPFDATPTPGKLFVVGDPKQSIYRFRRADIVIYHKVKEFLCSHGAKSAELSTNFRSVPGISAAINGAFELAMTDYPQAKYVPLFPARARFDSQPSVVVIPAPRPFSAYDKITKGNVEAHVPDAVGAFIHWLISQSKWTVDENHVRVPISARHICILFKRMTGFGDSDLVRPYTAALEVRKVPHVVVGGRSFHDREEIAALRTVLNAIERPDDELSVFAVLRGPFLGFHDEALFEFRGQFKKLQPMFRYDLSAASDECKDVASVLAVLQRLHRERNSRTVAATLNDFLTATRAHAGIAFWSHGAQALANVLQLSELVQQLESHASSFRNVLDDLEQYANDRESAEAPLIETGTEGVRMMTVHQAKGLEFPVVILAEPTANAKREKPTHAVDNDKRQWLFSLAGCTPVELNEQSAEVLAREYEESVRITYVAATRARDLLVIPSVSEERLADTWTSVLYPSIYPAASSNQQAREAPGCPPLGTDCVADRMTQIPDRSVRPGLHLSETKKNRVVWWSAGALNLGLVESGGLELEEALLDDEQSAHGRALYEESLNLRSTALTNGLLPKHVVQAAREVQLPQLHRIEIEDVAPKRSESVRGVRFGLLVHAVLSHVSFDADAVAVEQLVSQHARALRATSDECRAAIASVVAALRSHVLTLAKTASEVRREAPMTDVLPTGELVEGVIDLAFKRENSWHIVEYKTDFDVGQSLDAYERQISVYVNALNQATGCTVTGSILKI